MYTKNRFGQDLKRKVIEKQKVSDIGAWAYSVYLDWKDTNDVDFLNLLIHLNTMELGSEFALSYEELGKIADDLIAGKDVKLCSPSYCIGKLVLKIFNKIGELRVSNKNKFEFDEIVEVISSKFEDRKIDGYRGAVVGMACNEIEHWSYLVLLFDFEECLSFDEENLKTTREFVPEDFNKKDETIRVVVNKKGEGRIKDE